MYLFLYINILCYILFAQNFCAALFLHKHFFAGPACTHAFFCTKPCILSAQNFWAAFFLHNLFLCSIFFAQNFYADLSAQLLHENQRFALIGPSPRRGAKDFCLKLPTPSMPLRWWKRTKHPERFVHWKTTFWWVCCILENIFPIVLKNILDQHFFFENKFIVQINLSWE